MAFMLWIISALFCVSSAVVVETENGAIVGYTLNVTGRNYNGNDIKFLDMFLGIPYAEPPIGQLRFARPVPKASWKPNTHDALAFGPTCEQQKFGLQKYSLGVDFDNFDEDCLYLNVFAPHPSAHVTAPFPVMVWIHGGAYIYGSSTEFDGRFLALEGVVVVTMNYRLGIFGFLSTDDDVAPGNYGLLDQLLALQWVQSNIRHFNGDPNKVTIFGHSAGGGSVSLHMFSKLAKGLFHSVIAQSGVAISPWAIYRPPHKPKTYATELASKLNCDTSSSDVMIACLRSKHPAYLIRANVTSPPNTASFVPTVDNYYITDLPETLLERGDFLKGVRIMTGFVPQETSPIFANETNIVNGLTGQQLENIFHSESRRYLGQADMMLNALKCAYPPSTDLKVNRKYAIDMTSDYNMIAPEIKFATELANQGTKVWVYDFMYLSRASRRELWIGVTHADEVYYLFGAPLWKTIPCPGPKADTCPSIWGSHQPWNTDDNEVSYAIMKVWSDFAKLNDSVTTIHEGELANSWPSFDWPQYDSHQTILYIDHPMAVKHMYKSRGLQFWESFNYLNMSERIPYLCNPTIFVG